MRKKTDFLYCIPLSLLLYFPPFLSVAFMYISLCRFHSGLCSLFCDLLLLFPHGISWDICFIKQSLREKSVFNIKGYVQCCSRNQLAVLPVSLCVLSSLEVLCASNNKLVSLPEEIGKLDRLMDLVILGKTLQKHCFYFREMTSGFLSVCLFFLSFIFRFYVNSLF